MPKRVFWPVTLVIMGIIFLGSNLGYLPATLWNLWPIIFIVVGLGGLVTADREEWYITPKVNKKVKTTVSKTKTKNKKR